MGERVVNSAVMPKGFDNSELQFFAAHASSNRMNSQLQFPSDPVVAPGDIRGWLLVLCLLLTFVDPASGLYHILSHTVPTLITAHSLNRVYVLSVYTFVFSTLAVFSFVAGAGLWLVKPKAVAFAKRYLLTNLIAHVAYFVVWTAVIRPTRQVNYAEMGWWNVLRPMLFVTLWYSYLKHSKRVRETYPLP